MTTFTIHHGRERYREHKAVVMLLGSGARFAWFQAWLFHWLWNAEQVTPPVCHCTPLLPFEIHMLYSSIYPLFSYLHLSLGGLTLHRSCVGVFFRMGAEAACCYSEGIISTAGEKAIADEADPGQNGIMRSLKAWARGRLRKRVWLLIFCAHELLQLT